MSEFVQKKCASPHALTLRGRLVELRRPLVMGILNVTPDSFYEGSRVRAGEAVERAGRMIAEGADIIDIGACSTRPGGRPVEEDEELERLEGVVPRIREAYPEALISVDTFRSRVAGECVENWGADVINDISGGKDAGMFGIAARSGCWYVLTHNRGIEATTDCREDYGPDIAATVLSEMAFSMGEARQAGVCNLIADPGFGFGKTADQDLALLGSLEELGELGCPIMVGMSRKRMAREAAECGAEDSLTPTIALNVVALMKGASIIRVHDVRDGVMTVKTIEKILRAEV